MSRVLIEKLTRDGDRGNQGVRFVRENVLRGPTSCERNTEVFNYQHYFVACHPYLQAITVLAGVDLQGDSLATNINSLFTQYQLLE